MSHLNTRLLYLAKVSRHITSDCAWLRLLTAELAPVMHHLRDHRLLSSERRGQASRPVSMQLQANQNVSKVTPQQSLLSEQRGQASGLVNMQL